MTAPVEIDPRVVSAAAHRALPHANPLAVAQMDALVEAALAHDPGTALDVGCGPGAFAFALAERAEVAVIGLDINADFLERARAEAGARTLRGGVTFVEQPAAEYAGGPFDLAVCLGASQAFGAPRDAVAALVERVHPGGTVVYGDLVWTGPPPPAFLEFLGVTEGFTWSGAAAGPVFAAYGLRIVAEEHASPADWEHYETAVRDGRLAFAATLPDVAAAAVRERAERWRRAYAEYGRECLGFSAYVAQRQPAP